VAGAELVEWLEGWYQAQCDGDWEHQKASRSERWTTLAGELKSTFKGQHSNGASFQSLMSALGQTTTGSDCRTSDGRFLGHGGARNLAEILSIFRGWASDGNGWRRRTHTALHPPERLASPWRSSAPSRRPAV
jgi:Immunity protein 53